MRLKKTQEKMETEPLPLLEEQELTRYLNEESQSMDPEAYSEQYVKILRANVALLIAENSKNDNFDASIPYLAMNYFDRFISRRSLPTLRKNDVHYRARVIAISCLCLAWKMRNKAFTYKAFLESKPNLNINEKDNIKVERLILRALGWRMYCINALCFVSNFLASVGNQDVSSKANVIELIIQSQGDIYFTQFKPSVIAASAILVICPGSSHSAYKDVFTSKVNLDEFKLTACQLRMSEIAQKTAIGSTAEASVARAPPLHEIEEVEERDLLNFELKWTDESQDLTMDSNLFPPDDGCLKKMLFCCWGL